jgi:soluble lytic murein transglycosylase-like protein
MRRVLLILWAFCCGCASTAHTHGALAPSQWQLPALETLSRVERCEVLQAPIQKAAEDAQLDPALVNAMIRVESSFNPRARSRAGALGLMQVMPATGRGNKCGDLLDPLANLRCGVRVLVRFLKRYEGSWVYGLSAYNGGYRHATKPHRSHRLPRNFKYVEKVLTARSDFLRRQCGFLRPNR